jgi:hypothetical protein
VVEVVTQKHNSIIVTLPRICVWFADDFVDSSCNAVLELVGQFLDIPKGKLITAYWDEQNARYNNVTMKYLPSYSFECRNLTLYDDE